jgi:hypothetical protein
MIAQIPLRTSHPAASRIAGRKKDARNINQAAITHAIAAAFTIAAL